MQIRFGKKISRKHLIYYCLLSIIALFITVCTVLHYKTLYEKEKTSLINLKASVQTSIAKQANTRSYSTNSQIETSGNFISIHARQMPIQSFLESMTQIKHKNLILSSDVKGNIHINFERLSWDEAFQAVLKAYGLRQKNLGSTYFIGTEKELAEKEQEYYEAQKKLLQTIPLQSQLLPIKYGKASDYLDLLKNRENSLLSERGNASIDQRTNTLWLRDTPSQLKNVSALIHSLDHPVKQVMIEARIVNVDNNFEKNLGVRLGLSHAQKISEEVGTKGDAFHLDLLESQKADRPDIFGLALFRIAPKTFLDLELSALEAEGKAKIISSPHIITTNQQEASIESGEEIPYQLSTKSGATAVTYKKAALSLKVLPQITPNNKIILTLQVNQDRALFTKPISGGIPIQTRQITSHVLISNGETIVIGGIYEHSVSNSIMRLPILGDLPLLGPLFRKNHDVNNRQELVIFVTPHIVEEQTE